MSFTLSYTCRDKLVITKLSIGHLTPYAAVCYALLQSGVAAEAHQAVWLGTYEGIIEVAKQLGITNVQFRKMGKNN